MRSGADSSGWYRATPEGWLLAIHVQPGAKKSAIAGLHGGSLKLRIAATPVEGKANEAVKSFLAAALGVPRNCVSVIRGGRNREKQVLVSALQVHPGLLLPD